MRVAIYARVSTDEQTEQNQVPVLEKWAADRGWEVVGVYRETGSAYQHADQKELRRLLEDCRLGKAQAVLVFDLSRLTRQGPYETMSVVRRFAQAGAEVRSVQESWLEQFTSPYMREAFIGFMGYLHNEESRIKSERTKAGMARVKASGKHVGRPRKKGVTETPTPFSPETKLTEVP